MPKQAPARPREHWNTRLGVVLAVAGAAVGLGNFLRFPGLAVQYGGGVFLIPYFVAIVLIGIPIGWAEWTLGRCGGRLGYNSAPGILRAVTGWRHGHYLGVLALLVPLIIYMYYVYIEAWCLAYAWYYATGQLDLGSDPAAYARFFEGLVGTASNGAVIASSGVPILTALAVTFSVNIYLIYRGLTGGIERFCRVAMPVLILCAVLVLIRVLTLGTPNPELPEQNVLNGLGFMWNPRIAPGESLLSTLANPEMWLQATGQVFFSISIGFGIILSYASYVRPDDDIVLASLTSTATNEFCEVCLGGLITITAAFIFLGAAPVEKVAGSTFGVGFYTLPVVFQHMPLGSFFGFLWFFLLFLAAATSSISMLQPVLSFLVEGVRMPRPRALTGLALVAGLGSLLVVFLSRDLIALDVMDFWVGQVGIFVLATTIVLTFTLGLGVQRGIEEAERGADLRLPRGFAFVIKYVSPTYLLVIFALFLTRNAAPYFRQLIADPAALVTVAFVCCVAALAIALVSYAGRRWTAAERGLLP